MEDRKMSNMNLLVVILKHEDLVSEICKELVEEGIHGGTIVDGTGMASVVEKMDDLPIFECFVPSLRMMTIMKW